MSDEKHSIHTNKIIIECMAMLMTQLIQSKLFSYANHHLVHGKSMAGQLAFNWRAFFFSNKIFKLNYVHTVLHQFITEKKSKRAPTLPLDKSRIFGLGLPASSELSNGLRIESTVNSDAKIGTTKKVHRKNKIFNQRIGWHLLITTG